ncbi:pectate lyase [Neolewinella litorea]|uniref:Pectate lyase n=2 Tax=Neolewinella litorea TaxID=2562452 RepID=A0A4S4NPX3_9BACT|nr:pectate lyase [Neolewinella litorea]
MLLYQRDNGGWPQDHGDAVDYASPLTAQERAAVAADKSKEDATLDDHSTTREIDYLLTAFEKTGATAYHEAAVRGLEFLLAAQNAAGGWPQKYPDTSGYHGHITYNDNVMVDVMNLLYGVADGKGKYGSLAQDLRERAKAAVERGIRCILNTQVVAPDGRLTVWGAQHDRHTLRPAPARKFEPATLSGSESVGIVRFLMRLPAPDERVKRSIRAAVAFLDSVRIEGYRMDRIDDPRQPTGRDRIIVADSSETLWARFYELETYRPVFTGRDAVVHYRLADIENERRVGYGFYGSWPRDLIRKEYPAWEERVAR